MKKPPLHGRWLLALLLVLGWASAAQAQLWIQDYPVAADPVFFTESSYVNIFYDASKGNGALLGANPDDVYLWTGVITDKSNGQWTHVSSPNFNVPDPLAKMKSIGNNQYRITINTPRTFYPGLAADEKILKLAMILRSGDGRIVGRDKDGGDLYLDATPASTLRVLFSSPNRNQNVAAGTQVRVEGQASLRSTLVLSLNGTEVGRTTETAFSQVLTITKPGENLVTITATSGAATATASTTLIVPPAPTVAALPAGANPNGITYLNGGTSAILTLTAPNKSYVHVLGDFNNWQITSAGLLNKTSTADTDPATGRWWVRVDGLTPGTEYAYQFLVNGQLRVADPYCQKILDPDNDKNIPTSTYPGLVAAYPIGKTTGIVSVLQPGKAAYNWTATSFQRPARTNMVVYELLVRDFVAAHDYKTLRDTLSYIQRLGANVIELLPINEFDNNDSWGYNPSFYFAPDKYYGTQDALKAFIDECHRRGIAVVLDMVLNHSSGNSPMVQLYGNISSGPTADNPWFNTVAPHPYSVYNDLNHESPYTRLFTKNVIKFWLQEYHVDGYRFDLAGGFSQAPKTTDNYGNYDQSRVTIWEDYYNYQMSVDNTSYPILEHFPNGVSSTNPTDEGKVLSDYGLMLWSNLNYNYTQAAMGYSEGWDLSYGYYGGQGGRGWGAPNAIAYMESHDEERMQFKNKTYGNASGSYNVKDLATGLQRDELAAALFFTQPGPRLVWQFGEVGYDYSINTCSDGTTISNNCRTAAKPIRWDYYQQANRRHLYDTYRALITLKKQPVFAAPTAYTQNLGGAVKTISLTGSDLSVVSFGNFDVVAKTATITFPATGTWYNYLDGTQLAVTSPAMPMSLQPGQYAVYTSRKITVPTGSTLATRAAETAVFQLSVAPNPAAGTTTIAYALPTAATTTIVVQNLLGQTIRQLAPARQAAGPQTQALPLQGLAPGVYLVRLQAEGQTQTARLLVQ